MSKVKCIIKYPDSLITGFSEFQINFSDAIETITTPGTMEVTNDNVDVSSMIHVFGIAFGFQNAVCQMDVFVDGEKINSEPIKPEYKPNTSGHLFNWLKV